MSLTIGRVGVAAANGGDGSTLAGPLNVARDGSTVTVTGAVYGLAHAESVWQARQLVGLADADEPIVPVTFSDASELDGFYRVESASADYQMAGTATREAFIPWQVVLEEISGFRLPAIESSVLYGLVANGVGITSYDVAFGIPGTVVDYYQDITGSQTTRPVAEGGSARVWYGNGFTTVGPTSTLSRLVVKPGVAYHASARVDYEVSSAVYRAATGRPSWPFAGDVRLSNGLVRVEWSAATSSTLTLSWWDGSTWSALSTFSLTAPSSAGTFTAATARVVRNTPEQCVVRFTATPSNQVYGSVTFDVMVRRGVRWATVYCQSPLNMIWVCGFTSTTATTAITGGLLRTSNNVSGDRELIVTPVAATANHTTGTLTVNIGARTALFGIGCEVNGSVATGRDVNGEQRDEFFGLYEERGLVVAS